MSERVAGLIAAATAGMAALVAAAFTIALYPLLALVVRQGFWRHPLFEPWRWAFDAQMDAVEWVLRKAGFSR